MAVTDRVRNFLQWIVDNDDATQRPVSGPRDNYVLAPPLLTPLGLTKYELSALMRCEFAPWDFRTLLDDAAAAYRTEREYDALASISLRDRDDREVTSAMGVFRPGDGTAEELVFRGSIEGTRPFLDLATVAKANLLSSPAPGDRYDVEKPCSLQGQREVRLRVVAPDGVYHLFFVAEDDSGRRHRLSRVLRQPRK